MSCAKAAEPIEMPFGLRTCVGPRKHILGGLHTGTTWRIPLNHPCVVAMRPFCQITLTTFFIQFPSFCNTVKLHYNRLGCEGYSVNTDFFLVPDESLVISMRFCSSFL